jgi:hypothetical protein
MKYLKLFEDYNSSEYRISESELDFPYLFFKLNDIDYKIDIDKSEVIKFKFMDEQSPTLNYIKSDKFVDDLQDELFKSDIMDYSAEEIQYIILKTGIYKNQEVIDYIKERLSDLNQYTSDKYSDSIFYGKSKDKLIFEYNSKNKYINLYNNNFSNKLLNHFNLQRIEIEAIVLNYVVDTLQIKVNYINLILF